MITIVQGRRDLATMRGGKDKYNNQQWLMGGSKTRGEATMMIMASKTVEAWTTKMRTTQGGAEEEDAVCHQTTAAVAASPCPPPPCMSHSLPSAPTMVVVWAVVVAVEDNNHC